MKSLLISSIYFPPQVGGISHMMADIVSALGPDDVCCLTGVTAKAGNTRKVVKPRVYRRPLAFAKPNYLQAFGWSMATAEIMLRERPKIVQLATVDEGYLGLWLKRWCRLPFVLYAHGNEILATLRNNDWLKPKLALKHSDCVIANSRFTASLVEKTGVDSEKIEIVHPGCNIDNFSPRQPRLDLKRRLLGSRSNSRVILTVGGLVARKGHDMVIRSLPRVYQAVEDVTYLVVGDGPYRAHLESLAASIGVRDRVVFAGELSDEELPDVYALSDVFVMPSREMLDECIVEGFGIVFLEANACGKPVVGGRSGGVPDAVVDGTTGLLVHPNDPEDIANAIARILGDSDLALQLGEQGRLRAVSEFAWPQVGRRIHAILNRVVSEANV